MLLIYVVIWGLMLVAGASAVIALAWCVQQGHLRQTVQQASSILEPDDGPTACGTALSTRGD